MERVTITLFRGSSGRIEATCDDPSKANCSFVGKNGIGERCVCVRAATKGLAALYANLEENEPGLINKALKNGAHCVSK